MADILFIITDTIYTIFMLFLYTLPISLSLWLFILKKKYTSWPLLAIIIEKRGNNLLLTEDRIGKYLDKFTGLQGYKFLKSKDTTPVVNFEWILHYNAQHTSIFRRIENLLRTNNGVIFFFKYGSKQLKPVQISKSKDSKIKFQPIKDKNGNDIIIPIYEQFDPRNHLGALDFEVIDWDNMGWMVLEQRASIERRKKKDDWVKNILMPLSALVVTGLICIIMIYYGYQFAAHLAGLNNPPTNTTTTNTQPSLTGGLIPGF